MVTSGSQVTETDIVKVVDAYLENVPSLFESKFRGLPRPIQENYMFNVFGQEKYLLLTNFDMKSLPAKVLKRLSVHLLKQFVVQVEVDNLWYWALTHDVCLLSSCREFLRDWPQMDLMSALFAAHFAKLSYRPSSLASYKLNEVVHTVVREPVNELVMQRDMIATYLCYPTLEGLVKFALSSVVDPQGFVIARELTDGTRTYRSGLPIRSLAFLLRALETNASTLFSDPDFAANLKDFRIQTEATVPPPPHLNMSDGWDAVYHLRNMALHGASGWERRSGLITNLICLIIWHLIGDEKSEEALNEIRTRPKHFSFPNWYYPPEL